MKTSRIDAKREARSQTGITHHTINPILHVHFYILKCRWYMYNELFIMASIWLSINPIHLKTKTKTKTKNIIFSFSTLKNEFNMGHVYIQYYESQHIVLCSALMVLMTSEILRGRKTNKLSAHVHLVKQYLNEFFELIIIFWLIDKSL